MVVRPRLVLTLLSRSHQADVVVTRAAPAAANKSIHYRTPCLVNEFYRILFKSLHFFYYNFSFFFPSFFFWRKATLRRTMTRSSKIYCHSGPTRLGEVETREVCVMMEKSIGRASKLVARYSDCIGDTFHRSRAQLARRHFLRVRIRVFPLALSKACATILVPAWVYSRFRVPDVTMR